MNKMPFELLWDNTSMERIPTKRMVKRLPRKLKKKLIKEKIMKDVKGMLFEYWKQGLTFDPKIKL